MDLLVITNKNKLHYVYIKDFNRFISYIMSILKILTDLYVVRQNVKVKNTFADIVYEALVVKEIW